MKKHLFITGTFLLILSLSGCFNPIFYEVKNDVAPEELTIKGVVRTIVRYTVDDQEFLVTLSDDGIKYKPVDLTSNQYGAHGFWKEYTTLPEDYEPHAYKYYEEKHVGVQLLKLIADSKYLYLVTASYTKDIEEGSAVPDEISLYVTEIPGLSDSENKDWSAGTWQKIDAASDLMMVFKPESSDYTFSAFNVFSTNSVQKDHRKAYLRSSGFYNVSIISMTDEEISTYENPVYYELNGTELTPITVSALDSDLAESLVTYFGCNSAVWTTDGVKFFVSTAAETNETYTSDATVIYLGYGTKIYYYLVSDLSSRVECFSVGSATVSCLSYCADSLLIGRGNVHATSTSASGGIAKANLVNGLPKQYSDGSFEGIVSFTTNAEIKLKTAYLILTVLCEDPSKTELENNIYSSITFIGTGTSTSAVYDNIGLWAYYPTRGNWNCE